MIKPMMVITTSISIRVNPCSLSRRRLVPIYARTTAYAPPGAAFAVAASSVAIHLVARDWVASAFMLRSPASSDDLVHRQERCHDRDDQSADHEADGDDRERTDNADDAVKVALQLGLVKIGDPSGKHRQLSGLLAQAQHAN